jgi:hypothetical protein
LKPIPAILLLLILSVPAFSQQRDSTTAAADSAALEKARRKATYSAPRKASLMSAILPGLGQIYNRKYWKPPIIYAGMGVCGYMFVTNHREYQYYRKNLIAENDNDPNTQNTTRWNTYELQTQKIAYQKRRDLAAVGLLVVYVLNIIDANVDAHLKTFDVSDDLSIKVEPWHSLQQDHYGFRTALGFSVKLNLK